MSDHDVRPNSRNWRVLTQICRTFDQQYSRIHVHVIVVKNGGCNTSHSKQKLRISSLFPILLKYQRKICQPSGFSNSRKLKNPPPLQKSIGLVRNVVSFICNNIC